MKKTLCIVLAVLMIVVLFSGCAGEPEPLRIVVDLEHLGFEYDFSIEDAVNGFTLRVSEATGIEDIVIESLPGSFEGRNARKAMLSRLRAEIMAGEGPDVFILGCSGGYFGNTDDPFIAIPEKAMANGMFLPLDDYMEDAQFTDWDRLLPQVMAAGQNEYGQQIVPISYTMPLTVFRAEDVPEEYPAETTWQDMLSDETGVLSAASTWFHSGGTYFEFYEGAYLESVLGTLADYDNEELLFTEEELTQRLTEVLEQHRKYRNGEFPEVPLHFQMLMGVDYDMGSLSSQSWAPSMDPYNGIVKTDPQRMVPIYSADGGVTATVISYAAVNVNTRRPEEAFSVIDYLVSLPELKQSSMGWNWLYSNGAVPIHMDAMSTKNPVANPVWKEVWFMRDENFEEFSRVREQITHVNFRGGLSTELKWLYSSCQGQYVYDMPSSTTVEENVHEYYRKMKRLLGE
ncbi:MAG: carbohydrate ABC transporter substrate-binding protein [Lachnospiraceae bacterium]|nr:carbohydrate ABC transporter substrate-binding protein [Clostridia bacterium]MBQ6856257.1 carbohydrate ABC transporter substrate-binding protein [Lachnospiraceae bacterium]